MSFHILNGDSLAQTFAQSNIPGHRIICRECLIDGPAQAADLDNFWSIRANFIAQGYGEAREKYYDKVVKELDQIQRLPEEAEINLWFEDDVLTEIQWGVLIDENDEVVWPKAREQAVDLNA